MSRVWKNNHKAKIHYGEQERQNSLHDKGKSTQAAGWENRPVVLGNSLFLQASFLLNSCLCCRMRASICFRDTILQLSETPLKTKQTIVFLTLKPEATST